MSKGSRNDYAIDDFELDGCWTYDLSDGESRIGVVVGFGLHVIQYPSGRYGFVGSVPAQLGFVTKAGNAVTNAEVESQLMLPAKHRTIKTRTFESEDAAWFEAARLGFIKAVVE